MAHHNFEDVVTLDLGSAGSIRGIRITKVSESLGKKENIFTYDGEVKFTEILDGVEVESTARLYIMRGAYLKKH
jgi:hypothetical protein